MTTTTTIDLSRIDLLDLIGSEVTLRRKAGTHGGEYAGPCPWCGGRDRFRVWPESGRYWCRQCDKKGDAIQYLRDREGLTFAEACERLGVEAERGRTQHTPATPPPPPPRERLSAPGEAWQERARSFVRYAQEQLWTDAGREGLAYLREKRGLSDAVIRAAGLGWNLKDLRDTPGRWGLDGKKVWLPAGVVIPWEIGGELWRVNVRRRDGDIAEDRARYERQGKGKGPTKCIGPRGWAGGSPLYNADALTADRPAVLVEGELDALTITQHAGDIVTAVATGSTGGARRTRWIARLALPPLVLVAYDADEGGDKAAKYWLSVLAKAKRWRPFWGDANAMAQDGADVRAWLAAGVGDAGQADAVDPTANLLRQLRAERDDQKWCALLGELNRELVHLGELPATYHVDGVTFTTFGCEGLTQVAHRRSKVNNIAGNKK